MGEPEPLIEMIAKDEVQLPAGAMDHCCGRCRHFCNDPARLEATFKGLSSLSSGFASVKSQDGTCDRHDLFLAYGDGCADFAPA